MKCTFDGCTKPKRRNNLCHAHSTQQWKGKELKQLRRTDERKLSIKQRIKNNIVKDADTKCWNWNLAIGTDGYGVFCHNGKNYKAHRISYAEHVGPVTAGSVVHHKCANRKCVNPKHLQLTSHNNNLAEMFERKEYVRRIKELEAKVKEYEKELSKANPDTAV